MTPTEPGFATPWTALGDMLFFADAKSASAAYTAMSQANDACGTTETQQHKATQATARRGASIAGGQSWTVTATGADNYVWEVHYYLVQHGSYIEALRVQQSPEGFSQIPAFTGTTATDTALLTDISNRLCGYAGAC